MQSVFCFKTYTGFLQNFPYARKHHGDGFARMIWFFSEKQKKKRNKKLNTDPDMFYS